MFWSALSRGTDKFCQPAPIWLERDVGRSVELHGYMVIESLVALLAGSVVIAAAVTVLAVLP